MASCFNNKVYSLLSLKRLVSNVQNWKIPADSLPEKVHIFGNTAFKETQAKNIIKKGVSKKIFIDIGCLKHVKSRCLVFHIERSACNSNKKQKYSVDPFKATECLRWEQGRIRAILL